MLFTTFALLLNSFSAVSGGAVLTSPVVDVPNNQFHIDIYINDLEDIEGNDKFTFVSTLNDGNNTYRDYFNLEYSVIEDSQLHEHYYLYFTTSTTQSNYFYRIQFANQDEDIDIDTGFDYLPLTHDVDDKEFELPTGTRGAYIFTITYYYMPYDIYVANYVTPYEDGTYPQGYQDGRREGYDTGYLDGYSQGFDEGSTEGYANGNASGYTTGYQNGYSTALSTHSFSFTNLFGSIADTPILMIRRLFGFELFGVSLIAVFMSLFTALLVIKIIKKVF